MVEIERRHRREVFVRGLKMHNGTDNLTEGKARTPMVLIAESYVFAFVSMETWRYLGSGIDSA